MDIDCPVDEPPQESTNHLYNLMGSAIALLTLVLPLYLTSHYSSGTAFPNTPLSQSSMGPVQR